MTTNVELIADVLAAIEQEPHRWDQGSWVAGTSTAETCDTSMCFAGWTLIKSGKFVLGDFAEVFTSYDPWTNKVYTDVQKDVRFYDIEALKFLEGSVSDTARDLLGFNDEAVARIFLYTSGVATRNPDAFRAYVVSVLLSEGLVNGNEAASLLDVTATRSYEDAGYQDHYDYSEQPF